MRRVLTSELTYMVVLNLYKSWHVVSTIEVYAVIVCRLSVHPSGKANIVSKRPYKSSWFWHVDLEYPSNFVHCVVRKFWALPSTLSQTQDGLRKFRHGKAIVLLTKLVDCRA